MNYSIKSVVKDKRGMGLFEMGFWLVSVIVVMGMIVFFFGFSFSDVGNGSDGSGTDGVSFSPSDDLGRSPFLGMISIIGFVAVMFVVWIYLKTAGEF